MRTGMAKSMAWERMREAVWTRTVSACLNPLVRPQAVIIIPHKISIMKTVVVLPTICCYQVEKQIWWATEIPPCNSWFQGFKHRGRQCVAQRPDHHTVQALLKMIRVMISSPTAPTTTTRLLNLYSFKEEEEALPTPLPNSCSSLTGITKLSIFRAKVVQQSPPP